MNKYQTHNPPKLKVCCGIVNQPYPCTNTDEEVLISEEITSFNKMEHLSIMWYLSELISLRFSYIFEYGEWSRLNGQPDHQIWHHQIIFGYIIKMKYTLIDRKIYIKKQELFKKYNVYFLKLSTICKKN